MKPYLTEHFGVPPERAVELEEIHCRIQPGETTELQVLSDIEKREDLTVPEKLILACVTGAAGECARSNPQEFQDFRRLMKLYSKTGRNLRLFFGTWWLVGSN